MTTAVNASLDHNDIPWHVSSIVTQKVCYPGSDKQSFGTLIDDASAVQLRVLFSARVGCPVKGDVHSIVEKNVAWMLKRVDRSLAPGSALVNDDAHVSPEQLQAELRWTP